jgi:cytochrome P450
MDSLSEEQLHALCLDYLLPGSTTVTATLNFAMAFLLNYPEVQTKMQEELDIKVGRDRLPTLDDRARSVNAIPGQS